MTDPDRQIPDPTIGATSGVIWGASTYGDSFADVYDDWYGDLDDQHEVADFVSSLAEAQTILELGTGTGRLVGPISDAGHTVFGLDASVAMLHRFSPDQTSAKLVAADMALLPYADASFDLVLVATNTLCNVNTVELQRQTLHEARRVLRRGGRFVTQVFVPPPHEPHLDRLVATKSITPDRVVVTATIRDETDQTITGQHIEFVDGDVRLRPWKIRYLHVEELHDLARQSGFALGAHYSSWQRAASTEHSPVSIAVYVAV